MKVSTPCNLTISLISRQKKRKGLKTKLSFPPKQAWSNVEAQGYRNRPQECVGLKGICPSTGITVEELEHVASSLISSVTASERGLQKESRTLVSRGEYIAQERIAAGDSAPGYILPSRDGLRYDPKAKFVAEHFKEGAFSCGFPEEKRLEGGGGVHQEWDGREKVKRRKTGERGERQLPDAMFPSIETRSGRVVLLSNPTSRDAPTAMQRTKRGSNPCPNFIVSVISCEGPGNDGSTENSGKEERNGECSEMCTGTDTGLEAEGTWYPGVCTFELLNTTTSSTPKMI